MIPAVVLVVAPVIELPPACGAEAPVPAAAKRVFIVAMSKRFARALPSSEA